MSDKLTDRQNVNRRSLLLGAAGALASAGIPWPASAAARAVSAAAQPRASFDPVLAGKLQRALHDALRTPGARFPGAILHAASPRLGTWTGAAGLGCVAPAIPMRGVDRFRAGSIVKPFVSVVVLQLAEERQLSLDTRLPAVLPASVVRRVDSAAQVSIRMLLSHRSGIPEWDIPPVDRKVARHPAKVWTVSEFLDLAAAQPRPFPPGTSYAYSNTDYTLLGAVIEHVTGHSWRHEVTRRVIRPLGLIRTALPAPGNRSLSGAHAHGYGELDGRRVDLTRVDPSFAGAAGASALITTVEDLARFLDALLKGRLFRHRQTLREMLAFAPAPDVGGQVGYGLGIERRVFPGGIEAIGHLGGAPGYRAYVARIHPPNATIALALNWQDDPTPLLLRALTALTANQH